MASEQSEAPTDLDALEAVTEAVGAGAGLPEVVRYVPLVLSGLLIVLFSIEHIIALLTDAEVEPTWH